MFSFLKKISNNKNKDSETIDLNQVAITTKYVVHNNSTITNVYHDTDGDWQFLGDEGVNETDALLLSLGQIFKLDPTIKDVLNLKSGQSAHRHSMTDRWAINN